MLKNVKNVYFPEKIEECYKLLTELKGNSELVGGGADLVWRERNDIENLIYLEKLNLNYIIEDNSFLRIGALTTLEELKNVNILKGSFSNSINEVATPILRNVFTVGGTIVRGYSWSDILTIFATCEAKVKIFDGKEKEILISQLIDYKKQKKKFILIESIIPKFDDSYHFSYLRFTRTKADIPLINEGVLIRLDNKIISKINILLGGRPGYPLHLNKVEEFLLGKELNEDNINKAMELAKETSITEDDIRLSKEYRKHLSGVLTKRNLIKIKKEI